MAEPVNHFPAPLIQFSKGCNNPVDGKDAHPLHPAIAFNIPVRRPLMALRTEGGKK